MALADVMKNLGFAERDEQLTAFRQMGEDLKLGENYPYKVVSVYTSGDVTALVEQNMSEDNAAGVDVVTKHPAVLILESPKGRVCVPNFDGDPGLVAQLVKELS